MWRRIIYHPEVNYALRQTLVLCIPVALGWLFGDLQKGLLFSLVPACCNVAGLDTPHKRFFKRLIVGGSLFALGSFLIQLLTLKGVPLPAVLFALPLLLGVTGEISPLHGRLLSGTLVAAIFTLSLIGRMPIYVPPLLYIGGTLWYGLFNWFWFWLWKEQPMRETLSLIYRELADYCDAKYTLLTQLTDPEKALPPLLARQQKAVDLINTCYQQMHMLSASRDNSHKRLTRAFQVALDLQEHISVSLHQPEEVQKLVERSHAEAVIRWNAKIISARLRALADAILYHQLPSRFDMEKPLGALEKIARQHPDNPVGHFCYYHFSRIARVLRTQKPLYQRDLMTDRQRRLPLLPALRSYLSLKSAALRTAARFAVMLIVTLVSYLVTRKYYGWSMIGFTVTAVYSLQLLSLNGAQFLLPRLMDTLMGCLIAFGGMLWLWPQWQSGLLRQNAHDALETYQDALRLLLGPEQEAKKLAWQRMQVNQAHNALFNSLNQAMQEPGFNAQYLKDMRLWVTHSQFIVEHINAMTILAREHTMLTPDLAQRYLQLCEVALQRCQQRLEYDGPGSQTNVMAGVENLDEGPTTILEQHVKRILEHLNVMHTISSLAWSQRPHHGRWLIRHLRKG